MTNSGEGCCPDCSPVGLDADAVHADIRRRVDENGSTMVGVEPENPYDIGFTYTIGRETTGQPELIVFGLDSPTRSSILDTVATKLARRRSWERRFITQLAPRKRVQLLPVADEWRFTHALLAMDYWGEQPFRLWQVRLPGADGKFSRDGSCCRPPCQPLLDRADPWRPIEHDPHPCATDVLWHRTGDEHGPWEGRWEQLGGLRLGSDRFAVLNVPFLADDVGVSDIVTARREASGRLVIHGVDIRSAFRTVRIQCEADPTAQERVDAVLDMIAEHGDVIWECSHWRRRHWTIGVPDSRVTEVDGLLRTLLRDGLVTYWVVEPGR